MSFCASESLPVKLIEVYILRCGGTTTEFAHNDIGALTKMQLTRLIRRHVAAQLYDESGTEASGIAIYTLSDPRDIRAVRYVGQSSAPRRRFLQHLNSARLWLPEEVP